MSINFAGEDGWPGWPELRGCPLPAAEADPTPFRLGGVVRSALGNAQRIDRLGDRWSCTYDTRLMDWEPEGRRWSVLIAQAEKKGGLFRLPQPGFRSYAIGQPVVATATPSGRFVPIAGLRPDGLVLAGQWVSIIVAGQRYADMVVGQAVAGLDGTTTIELVNLIRAPLPAGAVVELTVPKIEGSIEADGGKIATDGTTSWTITVTEDA